MNKRENFIITQDDSTAKELIKLGFDLINKTDGNYTFLNCGKLIFSDNIDEHKICYTNMMYI